MISTDLVHILVGEVYIHGDDADLLRPCVCLYVPWHGPARLAGAMILADSHCLELD